MNLQISDFDLHALLSFVDEMLAIRAETKGLEFILKYSADVPQYVKADEKKLRQILINLLGNAIKFTASGHVVLRATVCDPSVPVLLFEVEDTGAGISAEEIATLFEAFVQTETGQESLQGTGLGLPISQQFVELMGGTLTVESQVGTGTCFRFTIPVQIGEANNIQKPSNAPRVLALASHEQKYRILVVDDRWENRQLLLELLEPIGFQVQVAENGQEAVEKWKQWHPHLIWMDMRMPVMNGYEATRTIKSYLEGQATIIIALTASTLEEERSIVLSAGCDDFVRKPFVEATIFEKMAQYLGVQYRYEAEQTSNSESENLLSTTLTADALSVMPKEWLWELSEAASLIDDQLISQLLSKIPSEHYFLAQAIQRKVDGFDFDHILTLTQEVLN